MQSIPLLPSLLCPLWPGVVAPFRVISMDQIELYANKSLMLNWIVRNRNVGSFNCVYLQNVLPNHIYLIYIYKNRIWHWITDNGWYAIKSNKKKRCLIRTIIRQQCNFKSSSSSSGRTISTDIPDPFSPPLCIVHRFWQVFRATSCIGTELLYKGSSWSSCLYWSMWRGP